MTLDPQQLRSQLLDHRALDLDAARRVTYVIEQTFRYEYDAPVQSLRQRLVIVPRECPNMAAMVGSEQPKVLAVVAKLCLRV